MVTGHFFRPIFWWLFFLKGRQNFYLGLQKRCVFLEGFISWQPKTFLLGIWGWKTVTDSERGDLLFYCDTYALEGVANCYTTSLGNFEQLACPGDLVAAFGKRHEETIRSSLKRPASSSGGRRMAVLVSETCEPEEQGKLKDMEGLTWQAKQEQLQEEWMDMCSHNKKFMYRGLDGKLFDSAVNMCCSCFSV